MKIEQVLGISKNNIGELDGLRGIAVLMVFIYHVLGSIGTSSLGVLGHNIMPLLMWGHMGVNLFYILSGFLLFLPFAKAYYTSAEIDLKEYFTKRALRILPAYYFYIIVHTLLINSQLISADGIKILLGNMFFLQNFKILNLQTINPVTWTLVVEVQFYILLPFIYKFFVGKKIWKPLGISFILVTIYRLIVFLTLKPSMAGIDWNYYTYSEYNILGCFDNFAIGMIIANMYIGKNYIFSEDKIDKFVKISNKLVYFIPIAIAMLGYNYYYWRFTKSVTHSIYFSFLFDASFYMAMSVFLILILFSENKVKLIFNNILLRIMGVAGYSIYLWHLVLQSILANINFISKTENLIIKYLKLLGLSTIIILPFCIMLYVFVEKYFIDISKKMFKSS
ncbi:MAG: acyltransferase family protein [Proteocatella sp.]